MQTWLVVEACRQPRRLHSAPTAVLDSVPQPWHLHCSWGRTDGLSWPLFRETLALPHSDKPRLLSITFSYLPNQPLVGNSYTICQVLLPAQCAALGLSLDHSFSVLTLRKYFPEEFASMMLGCCWLFFFFSFLITVVFSAPANQHWFFPVKQTFHFSGAELLLITADSSGLADQKREFLIQNIPQIALLVSLRDSEASQAGSSLSALLSVLTSEFPQQLSKFWVLKGFSSAKLSSPHFPSY